MSIQPLGIRDLQTVHENSRKETRKSVEESGEESSEESIEESDEEDDQDIQKNLIELESEERSHSYDLLQYSYTRLPCAAHKVRLDSL